MTRPASTSAIPSEISYRSAASLSAFFQKIRDSALLQFFRKQLQRGCGTFGKLAHRDECSKYINALQLVILALPEQTDLRRVASGFGEAEMLEGVVGQ